jgi:hypothetical protein
MVGGFDAIHGDVGVDLGGAGDAAEPGRNEGLVGLDGGCGDAEQVVGQAEHPAYFDDFVGAATAVSKASKVARSLRVRSTLTSTSKPRPIAAGLIRAA